MIKALSHDFTADAPASKRILGFDLIRGFLLLAILVSHIELPPNFYDFFTGRGRLFVSAAEGFFFLSGLLVGMVYRRRLKQGMWFIFKRMWGRAAELYVGSVILTLSFAFIIARTNHFYIKSGLPKPVDWHHVIIQTLLIRFEYGWADFLARFAILMLIAPFVFYLIAKARWRLVLAGIIITWYFRHQNFTLAWQIIFNGGMLMGFYWNELRARICSINSRQQQVIKRVLLATTALSFSLSYATVYVLSELNNFLPRLPSWLQSFTLEWNRFTHFTWTYADKWTMGPVRLILFFVWASVLYSWVEKHETAIDKRSRGVLKLIGQNSLFVYIFHSLIVLLFKFFIPARTHIWQNFVITSLALASLIGGTYLYRYIRLSWPQINSGNFYALMSRKGKALFQNRYAQPPSAASDRLQIKGLCGARPWSPA